MAGKTSTKKKIRGIFTNNREIRVVFYTVVVRNKALEEKYPGGLKGYIRTEPCEYNHDIAVSLQMSPADHETLLDKLEAAGLKEPEDFHYFDAVHLMLFPAQLTSHELGCPWLRAYNGLKGKTVVYYTEAIKS